MTTDIADEEGTAFERTGYVAVFRVDNVDHTGGELTFDLVERLQELK